MVDRQVDPDTRGVTTRETYPNLRSHRDSGESPNTKMNRSRRVRTPEDWSLREHPKEIRRHGVAGPSTEQTRVHVRGLEGREGASEGGPFQGTDDGDHSGDGRRGPFPGRMTGTIPGTDDWDPRTPSSEPTPVRRPSTRDRRETDTPLLISRIKRLLL